MAKNARHILISPTAVSCCVWTRRILAQKDTSSKDETFSMSPTNSSPTKNKTITDCRSFQGIAAQNDDVQELWPQATWLKNMDAAHEMVSSTVGARQSE